MYVFMYVCLSFPPSVCPSHCSSVCLCVCLCVCPVTTMQIILEVKNCVIEWVPNKKKKEGGVSGCTDSDVPEGTLWFIYNFLL